MTDKTRVDEFVEQVQKLGSTESESEIVYGLFGDEGIHNAFRGAAIGEDNDYTARRAYITEFMKQFDYQQMEGSYGGEGEGEQCCSVIRLGDQYFSAEWTYYSYNGCEYDGIEHSVHEVFPEQVTITVYR